MNKKINLYGRARRLSLIRNIAVIVGCIVAIVLLLKFIFAGTNTQVVVSEFDKLKKYFLDRGYTCELLSVNGAKCTSNNDYIKTTFYRYDGGFEYVSKTDSYSLYITHRLDKEDRIEFVTTSEAFAGYKNQKFICTYDKNVLTKVTECEAVAEDIKLDVKSYLGVIEHAQLDITTAVTSSGFSLDNLLINYEWSKK